MGALIDVIAEGIKQFGGEIIGGILFAVALWMFPGLRKFFGRKEDDSASEVKQELEKLKGILNESLKKDNTEEELQKQLDVLKQEEEQLARLKGVLQSHEEALSRTEAKTDEERQQRADLQRQIEEQRKEEARVKAEIQRRQEESRRKEELARQVEEKRREEERIRAEIQRKEEELRQAEARKAEEARKREEAQRQLEAMKKSSNVPSSDEWGNRFCKFVFYAVPPIFAVLVVVIGLIIIQPTHPEATDAQAQYALGVKYYSAGDFTEAVKWYRLSAEQGNAWAQFNLGLMYENGKGVPRNLDESRKWYQKAADQGDEYAKEALKRLNAQ